MQWTEKLEEVMGKVRSCEITPLAGLTEMLAFAAKEKKTINESSKEKVGTDNRDDLHRLTRAFRGE